MAAAETMAHDFLDLNGRQVHAFALEMQNLGFSRMTEKLLAMLGSGSWRRFRDGLGQWEFLDCEFDYFLSSQGVTRDAVINGVRDIEAKARLDEAMDERLTGGERRRLVVDARAANPHRPEREIEPFGLILREIRQMTDEFPKRPHREALGRAVRTWRETRGATTKRPNELRPRVDRFVASAKRLSEQELTDLIAKLTEEQDRRRDESRA